MGQHVAIMFRLSTLTHALTGIFCKIIKMRMLFQKKSSTGSQPLVTQRQQNHPVTIMPIKEEITQNSQY